MSDSITPVEFDPCPFCGGNIDITLATETIDCIEIGAECNVCHMEFHHTQNFAHSAVARIALNMSFLDLWNGRAKNE